MIKTASDNADAPRPSDAKLKYYWINICLLSGGFVIQQYFIASGDPVKNFYQIFFTLHVVIISNRQFAQRKYKVLTTHKCRFTSVPKQIIQIILFLFSAYHIAASISRYSRYKLQAENNAIYRKVIFRPRYYLRQARKSHPENTIMYI